MADVELLSEHARPGPTNPEPMTYGLVESEYVRYHPANTSFSDDEYGSEEEPEAA